MALISAVTVSIARSLYPTDPILRTTVSTAALILVEGSLFLAWETLDPQGKSATMTQHWLYAGLA
jgi:hypothetical protein